MAVKGCCRHLKTFPGAFGQKDFGVFSMKNQFPCSNNDQINANHGITGTAQNQITTPKE